MKKKKFYSTKTYGNDRGLSCCFRQVKATHSHCCKLHGYSIGIKLVFECDKLDERNWVVDFGSLKPLKTWLEDNFDHKVVLDTADPYIDTIKILENQGLAEINILDGVGVEKFAEHAYNKAQELVNEMTECRCWVESVECMEHGANSAIYYG